LPLKHLLDISTFILFLILSSSAISQVTIERQYIGTSSFQGELGGNISISSSIGQPFFTTITSGSKGLTQGFEQPSFRDCEGDFDNNGVVNITDLLIFISSFSSYNPSIDMNGDGFVGVTDLIIFITLLGTSCS